MPATVNGGGDQLARGAVRVQFRSANVSEEKFDEALEGFDLQKFLKKDNEVRGEKETTTTGLVRR